jgi:hypothetical protein
MKLFDGRAWFGVNAMGGLKPVSWEGWLLTASVFGFDFVSLYRGLSQMDNPVVTVWSMLLVTMAFFLIQSRTGGFSWPAKQRRR